MTSRSLVGLWAVVMTLMCAQEACGQARCPEKQRGVAPAADDSHPPRNERGLTWDSPALRELEQKLDSMAPSKDDPDDRWAVSQRKLRPLLESRFSRAQFHQLAASFHASPTENVAATNFQELLFSTMMEHFLRSNDRDGLVLLLSHRCPRYIGWGDVEHILPFMTGN